MVQATVIRCFFLPLFIRLFLMSGVRLDKFIMMRPWHGNHAISTLGLYTMFSSRGMPGKTFFLKTKTKNIFIVCFKRGTKSLATAFMLFVWWRTKSI